MKWSTRKPVKAGIYFWRNNNIKSLLTVASVNGKLQVVLNTGMDPTLIISSYTVLDMALWDNGEWAGPIPLPKEAQP
jgi:hypothetical protein